MNVFPGRFGQDFSYFTRKVQNTRRAHTHTVRFKTRFAEKKVLFRCEQAARPPKPELQEEKRRKASLSSWSAEMQNKCICSRRVTVFSGDRPLKEVTMQLAFLTFTVHTLVLRWQHCYARHFVLTFVQLKIHPSLLYSDFSFLMRTLRQSVKSVGRAFSFLLSKVLCLLVEFLIYSLLCN